jgi:hypothetical protein
MVFNFVKTLSHCKVGSLECFSLNIPIFSFLSVFFNSFSLFPLQMEIWVLFFVGLINSQISYNIRYQLGYLFFSLTIYYTKWTLYVMAIVVRWVDSTSNSCVLSFWVLFSFWCVDMKGPWSCVNEWQSLACESMKMLKFAIFTKR